MQNIFGIARQRLKFVVTRFGFRELHQLHFLKLMLANNAAHIPPVRPRFTPETRRIRAKLDGQLVQIQHFIAIQIRHRYFCGGDQVVIGSLQLEQIRLKLGQLPRAIKAIFIRDERRQHFGISVVLRMHIQHEIDQRAFQFRAQAHVNGKPRAGDLRRAIEIEDAQFRT